LFEKRKLFPQGRESLVSPERADKAENINLTWRIKAKQNAQDTIVSEHY